MKCTLKAYLLGGRTNGIRYTLDRCHCYFLRIFYLQILPLFQCLCQYCCIWLFAVESRCRFIATYAQMDVQQITAKYVFIIQIWFCDLHHILPINFCSIKHDTLAFWLWIRHTNLLSSQQVGGTIMWTETWLSLIITLEWQCVINTTYFHLHPISHW